MKINLDSWTWSWQSVLWDTEQGKGHYLWFGKEKKQRHGFAFRLGFKWYALWRSETGVIFQHKKLKIEISDKYQVSLTESGRNRKFTIRKGEAPVFELNYTYNKDSLDRIIALEDEDNDFFLWVATTINKPGGIASFKRFWSPP